MVSSFITIQAHVPILHNPFTRLNSSVVCSPSFLQKTAKNRVQSMVFNDFCTGFEEVRRRKGRRFGDSWCCLCKQSEDDIELEAEILEFMKKSEKPTMFPTKKELVKAGRMDLVEAVKKRGGWYSLGWDEDDENVVDKDNVVDAMVGEFQRRVEKCEQSASLRENYSDSLSVHGQEDDFSIGVHPDYRNSDSLQLASLSSSGRSIELGVNEDAGIDGILSRLEKQRNSDFGINLSKYGPDTLVTSQHEEYDMHLDTSKDVARTFLKDNMPEFHQKDILNKSITKTSPNIESESWRTWSHRRAGIRNAEFEAAEISYSKVQVESDKETYHDGSTATTEEFAEAWDRTKEINQNPIRTRLQELEYELTTALHSLRSKREESTPEKMSSLTAIGSTSDLENLSDAWEFQENELMSARERLRTMRAKLAVLEGKMALAIIEAQKIAEEKQKRVDCACKALQLLRTTFVVWPNSASEVLLAGSFDGWTSQRKMEKSKTGIFSVQLKLYPGRYEIKFIVDGIWRVDPLRPVVNNHGYENNLLIVT